MAITGSETPFCVANSVADFKTFLILFSVASKHFFLLGFFFGGCLGGAGGFGSTSGLASSLGGFAGFAGGLVGLGVVIGFVIRLTNGYKLFC